MIPQGHSKRLVTAICIIAILAAALYFDGWLLFAVILATSLIAQYEFYNMFWPGTTNMLPEKIGGLLAGCTIILAVFLEAKTAAMFAGIGACVMGAISFLIRYGTGKEDASLPQSMLLLAGFAYVPLLMQLVFCLSPMEIILILVAVSASDAAAYYVGSAWGKRKIWPRISPKKSILGSVGGLVACTITVAALGLIIWNGNGLYWVITGIIINIMSQLGDFFESALKRSSNVKDSGTILPGHGGVLDRIDSFLFALPTYVLLRMVFFA